MVSTTDSAAAVASAEHPRPVLARWASVAGVIANVVLVITFFLNWTWQAQLGAVLPFGLVWFVGWWFYQGALTRFEVAELEATVVREAETAARLRAERVAGGADALARYGADWEFEMRYQERRAEERREAAATELARQREWERMGVVERWRTQRAEQARSPADAARPG